MASEFTGPKRVRTLARPGPGTLCKALMLAGLFATVVALPLASAAAGASTSASISSSSPDIYYLGVPSGAQAIYREVFTYLITVNGTQKLEQGNYTATVTATISGTGSTTFGVYTAASVDLDISNVSVSKGYNATWAGSTSSPKYPPTSQLGLYPKVYAANDSLIPPNIFISPNSQSVVTTKFDENITITRLASYSFSHGSIKFSGPAIYQEASGFINEGSGSSSNLTSVYYFDQASGLLLNSANFTILKFNSGNSRIVDNKTTTLSLMSTNVQSINPQGTATLPGSPTVPKSSSGGLNPLLIVVVIAVIILLVVIVGLFLRGRR